ncbi:MAG: hypothetical protein RL755_26 [Pseudomonadota bacterium]|jgi:hypothetical protein
MSDIKKQWQQAVEEFGDDAYKCFLVSYDADNWQPATSNQQLVMNVCDAKLKPLDELLELLK